MGKRLNLNRPPCPHCSSAQKVKLAGHAQHGDRTRRQYFCNWCGKYWVENAKRYQKFSDQDRENWELLRNQGKSITEIARLAGASPDTISQFFRRKYQDYLVSKLSV